MGLQQQGLQDKQHHQHRDMDGAHHHVRPVEGGQDPGDCLANRQISSHFCGQSDCDSKTFLARIFQCFGDSQHCIPLLIRASCRALYSSASYRVLHHRLHLLLCHLRFHHHHIPQFNILPEKGRQNELENDQQEINRFLQSQGYLFSQCQVHLLPQKQAQIHNLEAGVSKTDYKTLEKNAMNTFLVTMSHIL